MKVLVSSIEGGIASIEFENGKTQNIMKALLPFGIKVGDTIDVNSGLIEEGTSYKYENY